jgi:hypothetical protein
MDAPEFPMIPETSPWSWWKMRFPESWRVYGRPMEFGRINTDFLACTLGELPLGLIYYPPEGVFYFRDYLFKDALRPTREEKVSALFRKVVRESTLDAPRSHEEAAGALFQHSDMVVSRAKTILAAEAHIFSGIDGEMRYMEGKFIEPVEKPTVEMFVAERVTRKKGQILTTPLAYQFYYAFCREVGLPPVKKTIFTDRFAQEVRKKWRIGVRNDLKVDGRTHQGWGELAVL